MHDVLTFPHRDFRRVRMICHIPGAGPTNGTRLNSQAYVFINCSVFLSPHNGGAVGPGNDDFR